jgi:hypothetical protein
MHADNVNISGRNIYTIEKNAEALFISSKEIGLEVNADKTKYVVMSGDQNAGQNHNIKIDNSSFARVEEFKYLGTTLTNQNSVQEEIKSRLKSFCTEYFVFQFCIQIYKEKIYIAVILPVL